MNNISRVKSVFVHANNLVKSQIETLWYIFKYLYINSEVSCDINATYVVVCVYHATKTELGLCYLLEECLKQLI